MLGLSQKRYLGRREKVTRFASFLPFSSLHYRVGAFPFYRWKNGDSEKLSRIPKAT